MAHLASVSGKNMAHLALVSGKNMAHLSAVHAKNMAHEEGQQHPIKLYLVVWGWLFVLSTCSYLVDYFGIEGFLRWFLILLFMIVKAGMIVAVFMHMRWERLALMYAILAPPGAVLLFVGIMAFESNYTNFNRLAFFATGEASTQFASLEPQKSGSGTGTATAPSDQLKREARKDGVDISKPEVASEGREATLSGSESAPKEAGKTTPANGNPAGTIGTEEAGKTAPASGNPAGTIGTEEAGKTAPATGDPAGAAAIQHGVAAAAKALDVKFYTLKPGDTLWKVAEIEYGPGHGGEYHLIFEANKSLLSDPGKIYPGQVLRIPPLSG
jgi:cytochrome c oxidase subunit IV